MRIGRNRESEDRSDERWASPGPGIRPIERHPDPDARRQHEPIAAASDLRKCDWNEQHEDAVHREDVRKARLVDEERYEREGESRVFDQQLGVPGVKVDSKPTDQVSKRSDVDDESEIAEVDQSRACSRLRSHGAIRRAFLQLPIDDPRNETGYEYEDFCEAHVPERVPCPQQRGELQVGQRDDAQRQNTQAVDPNVPIASQSFTGEDAAAVIENRRVRRQAAPLYIFSLSASSQNWITREKW
jgi:hypothetical protein